jgi:hypothetical protein
MGTNRKLGRCGGGKLEELFSDCLIFLVKREKKSSAEIKIGE